MAPGPAAPPRGAAAQPQSVESDNSGTRPLDECQTIKLLLTRLNEESGPQSYGDANRHSEKEPQRREDAKGLNLSPRFNILCQIVYAAHRWPDTAMFRPAERGEFSSHRLVRSHRLQQVSHWVCGGVGQAISPVHVFILRFRSLVGRYCPCTLITFGSVASVLMNCSK